MHEPGAGGGTDPPARPALLHPEDGHHPDQLHQTLARTRQRGWALDDEAQALGMRCVAAPFFNAYGEAVAAISISGPTPRISDARIPVLGDLVARTAAGITHRIGGRPARGFHSPHVGAG